MPFCSQCGAELKEEDKYCPECGTAAVKIKESKKKPSKEAKKAEAAKSEEKPPKPAPPLKNSGWGIASFIMSLVAWIAWFILLFMSRIIEPPSGAEVLMVIGLLIGAGLFLLVVPMMGIGFGIAGVFQKDRKKLFAKLGFAFNIGTIGVVLVFIIVQVLLHTFGRTI